MTFKKLLEIPQEVICLSLSQCSERRAIFERKWSNHLKEKRFRYHITDKPTIDSLNLRFRNFSGSKIEKEGLSNKELGRWGCWLSHYEILCNAKNRGLESILILEDDTHPNIDLINKQVSSYPPDWDIIYLGVSDHDILAEFSYKTTPTEFTFKDRSSKYTYGGWKKVRAWGTYAMIIRNSAFDLYLKELKDYAPSCSSVRDIPTADGTYYWYLWKSLSFYFNEHFVLHDYTQESNIAIPG